MYGYYPVYLRREVGNFFHVNYFRNSNAMDVIKDGGKLTYRVIGGLFDYRFFLTDKQSPAQALQSFQQNYLGKSIIPPFWAMGFHQARFGYTSVAALENVIKNYEENNLPLDTIWADIDYMIEYEDFTID